MGAPQDMGAHQEMYTSLRWVQTPKMGGEHPRRWLQTPKKWVHPRRQIGAVPENGCNPQEMDAIPKMGAAPKRCVHPKNGCSP